MPAFLAPLAAWLTGNPWGRAVLFALAILTGGLILRARWVREGRQQAEQQQQAETLERYKERSDVEEDLRRLDPDSRRERLRDWTRD